MMKRDANGGFVPMLITADWSNTTAPIPDLLRVLDAQATELMGRPVSFVIPPQYVGSETLARLNAQAKK